MQWLNNLKMAYKLALGFGLCLAITLFVGGMSLARMASMDGMTKQIIDDGLEGVVTAGHLNDSIMKLRDQENEEVIESSQAKIAQIEAAAQQTITQVESNLSVYEKTVFEPADRASFDELKRLWQAYLPMHARLLEFARRNDDQGALQFLKGENGTAYHALGEQVDKIFAWNEQNGKALAHKSTEVSSSARMTVLVLLALAVFFSLAIAWTIARTVTQPLAQLSERLNALSGNCITNLNRAMNGLSHGDLTFTVHPSTRPLDIRQRDEFGALAQTFNTVLSKTQETVGAYNEAREFMNQLVGSVAESANGVAAASAQVSTSAQQTGAAANDIARTIQEVAGAADQSAVTSQEMAKGSEQQARSASDAAGAMERLQQAIAQVRAGGEAQQIAAQEADAGMQQAAQAVEEVARSAQQMASTAQHAASVAQTGGKAVEQTIESMSRIQEQVQVSSEKVLELGQKGQEIGAIIETIDQIAEQTNLLALNAAIEAARAGEHGKGFAVVADEVRKLAERAASATKEIGALIGSVRTGVEEAVEAMEQSSQEVRAGASRSEEAGSALAQILAEVQSVATEVESMTATAQAMTASVQSVRASVTSVRAAAEENEQAVNEMVVGADQVSGSISMVASVSQETAAGAEEMSASAQEVAASAQNVSAAVEEQTASVEEVSAAAGELTRMAARLQELVQQFRLETEAVPQTAPLRMTATGARKAA